MKNDQKMNLKTDKMYATRISIPADKRTPLVALLNQQLANLTDLYSQTKFAHWNVKGMHFIALHKLFDELAEKVEDAGDEVAERATALGGVAHGTTRMAATSSQLAEFDAGSFEGADVVGTVADRFAAVGASVRKAIDAADELDDTATADLLTGVVEMLDQSLCFLESHVQK